MKRQRIVGSPGLLKTSRKVCTIPSGPWPVLERSRSLPPPQPQVQSARELKKSAPERAREGPFATGVAALDRLLEGGLPRGHLIEVVGSRSSGRFSAALALLAAATGAGENAAFVDLGDGLDPQGAARLGVDLARLLWVRPGDFGKALASAEVLIDGGFPLVVVDLGNPPIRGARGAEAAWLRLARTARAHGCGLWVGSPYRVSGTAATAVLKMERAAARWDRDGACWLLGGISSQVSVEKLRGGRAAGRETLELRAESPRAPLPGAAIAPHSPEETAWRTSNRPPAEPCRASPASPSARSRWPPACAPSRICPESASPSPRAAAELADQGIYRIFRDAADGSWYADGVYD